MKTYFCKGQMLFLIQVGGYSKAVRMVELDLLVKRRYYMVTLSFFLCA